MEPDLELLLRSDQPGLWVGLDVACAAFDVDKRRIYQLAKQEGWRSTPGPRPVGRRRGIPPKQYSFNDIRRTWLQRKATQ